MLFGPKMKDDPEVALLCTLGDPFRTDILLGVLDENGIPYLKQDKGSGGVTRLVTGYNSLGCDIYVPASSADRATELMNNLFETLEMNLETTDADVEAAADSDAESEQ